MGIVTRLVDILMADIHGIMDQFENRNLLLRQYLREMEEEIHRKQIKLQQMTASNRQAIRDHDLFRQQCDALETDLTIAVKRGNDDIARMLIRKLKSTDHRRAELNRYFRTKEKETRQLKILLDQQRQRFEQLKQRSADYLQKTRTQFGEGNQLTTPPDQNGQLSDKEVDLELWKLKEGLSTKNRDPQFDWKSRYGGSTT